MRQALARAKVLRMGAAILSRVVDALLPRLCLSCDAIVATPGLCAACWARQRWLAPPHCAACGLPAGAEGEAMAPGWTCAACTVRRAAPRRTRAALRYDAASRELALRLKHADALHAAPGFATWMRAAGAELLAEADLLAPVPLHWTRLAWRRFNQAAVLARLVARGSGHECIPDLLVRRRRTAPQGGFGRAARRRNVAAAFAVAARHRAALAGRRVLLVDDVLTTGATLEACAAVLLAAGAAGVDALVLMRVARGPRLQALERSAALV